MVSKIAPKDEQYRADLGYQGHTPGAPRPHLRARRIRQMWPQQWDEYLTFTVVRNPFDWAVSWVYFHGGLKGQSMDDRIIDSGMQSNWWNYTADGEVIVDHVMRYENLDGEMAALSAVLGYEVELPPKRLKGAFRPPHTHYREQIGPAGRAHIEHICAAELDYFGYEW